ncbi:MAG: DUF6600 domain-containing protein [Acidobacteriota bacterium]
MQRAAAGETRAALINLPLDPGDRIWSGDDGRVELLFDDGSLLWMDEQTTIDLESFGGQAGGAGIIIRLWAGSIYVARPAPDRYHEPAGIARVDAPAASAVLPGSGLFRLDIDQEQRLWLSTYRGSGELIGGGRSEPVDAGEESYAEGNSAPARAIAFNTADQDTFDRWQAEQVARTALTEHHVRERSYVPRQIVHHAADLEGHGSWIYYDDYHTWAWHPYVAPYWSPFHDGRWVYAHHGWTWVPFAPWGYTTTHYGRWHFTSHYGWVWFPGSVYSPAWVQWYVTPYHVGWVPLNYFNRPAVSIGIFFGNGHSSHHFVHHPHSHDDHHDAVVHVGTHGSAFGGRAVQGRGFTSGLDRAWNFVPAGKLGSEDVTHLAVRRADVEAAEQGGPKARTLLSGALRPRRPTQLTPSVSRRAVPRTGLATPRRNSDAARRGERGSVTVPRSPSAGHKAVPRGGVRGIGRRSPARPLPSPVASPRRPRSSGSSSPASGRRTMIRSPSPPTPTARPHRQGRSIHAAPRPRTSSPARPKTIQRGGPRGSHSKIAKPRPTTGKSAKRGAPRRARSKAKGS